MRNNNSVRQLIAAENGKGPRSREKIGDLIYRDDNRCVTRVLGACFGKIISR